MIPIVHVSANKSLRTLAIVGFNAVIFFFIVRWCMENIQLEALRARLAELPASATLQIVVIHLVTLGIYSLRLGVLIDRRIHVSFPTAMLGFGLNSVLPMRLGEVAKIYYARRFYRLSGARLLAAVVAEKFLDLTVLAVLAILIVVVGLKEISFFGVDEVVILSAVVALGGTLALLHRRYDKSLDRRLSAWPRIRAILASLREQGRAHHLPALFSYTGLIWLFNIIVVYIGFFGYLPLVETGLADAMALVLIVALAVAIPSTPAGLGVFEAGIVAYLTQVLHVSSEQAVASAIVFHLAVTLPQVTLMLVVIARARLRRS